MEAASCPDNQEIVYSSSKAEPRCSISAVQRKPSVGCHFPKRGEAPTFIVMFSWASIDFEEGRKWLDRIKGLGTVMTEIVSESKSGIRLNDAELIWIH
jgi:hypothetical protein